MKPSQDEVAALLGRVRRAGTVAILGTDTGVGKTVLTRVLAQSLRESGTEVAAVKPIATGGRAGARGRWINGDASSAWRASSAAGRALLRECGVAEGAAIAQFAYPMAPVSAALREGRRLDLVAVERVLCRLEREARLVRMPFLVEGVGGPLVPLAARFAFVDLVARMGWPAVLCARSTLGTINHTLLSVEACEARGVRVLGVVLSRGRRNVDEVVERSSHAELRAWLPKSIALLKLPWRGARLEAG